MFILYVHHIFPYGCHSRRGVGGKKLPLFIKCYNGMCLEKSRSKPEKERWWAIDAPSTASGAWRSLTRGNSLFRKSNTLIINPRCFTPKTIDCQVSVSVNTDNLPLTPTGNQPQMQCTVFTWLNGLSLLITSTRPTPWRGQSNHNPGRAQKSFTKQALPLSREINRYQQIYIDSNALNTLLLLHNKIYIYTSSSNWKCNIFRNIEYF